MERNRRILIAPLDWGLGHATRCIPIINALLKRNVQVIIAGSGQSATLLKQEFPNLKQYDLPGYNPRYPTSGNMVWAMATQLPGFMKTIYDEHAQVQNIIKREKVSIIISDNRYGCYSSKIKSVFIGHQLNILMPEKFKRLQRTVNYFNLRQISNFNECWIPAPDNELLADLLPKSLPVNTRFIGYLSRFKKLPEEIKYDIVVVASGPDPQRKMLVHLLREQLKDSPFSAFLVQGQVRGNEKIYDYNNFTEANHLNSARLNIILQQAKLVIARSGYSTIMDLAKLGKNAIFIPTPGQTEQEYLARQLMDRGIAYTMPQQEFNLKEAIKKANKFGGFTNFEPDESLLDQAIESILK